MVLEDSYEIGINKCLCLPKADLKTKNSTKRQLNQTAALLSFGWVFGFQLDSLEKHLITLVAVTFTWSAKSRVKYQKLNQTIALLLFGSFFAVQFDSLEKKWLALCAAGPRAAVLVFLFYLFRSW